MRNLRLGSKIGLVIAVQIVIMLALVWINFWQMHCLHEKMQQTFLLAIPKGGAALRLRGLLLDSLRLLDNAVLSSNDEESKRYAEQSSEVLRQIGEQKQKLEELVKKEKSDEEVKYLDQFGQHWEGFTLMHRQIKDLAVLNTNSKANQLLEKKILNKLHLIRDAVQVLLKQIDRECARADMEKSSARLLTLHKRSRQLSEAYSIVQELYRLLDEHNSLETSAEQKAVIEAQQRALDKELDGLWQNVEAGVDVGDRGAFDRLAFDRALAALAEFRDLGQQVEQLSRLNSTPRSTKLALEGASTIVAGCDKVLGDMSDLYKRRIEDDRKNSEETYDRARWLMIGATLFGTLFSLGLSLLLTRAITRPLGNAAELARAMARGDLTQRLQVNQKDEIGQLCQAVDSVTCTLARIVTDIRLVSSNIGSSASGLSTVSEQLLSMSQEISLQASTVASASEQMAMNINTMAAAAEEMSMNVTSISSASEEMSVNISPISSAAEQTSQNVHQVAESIQDMTQRFGAVRQDVNSGSQIAGEAMEMAGNATRTMHALDASASEINKVTEMIKMIALQTNLLALNATIEATSAGEAGKGFAVVASEIKELANQSGRAAEDIARKIEAMQGSTREAVTVIQGVSKIISEINGASARIALSVEQQTHSADTIARNVSEASKGVGDIARSIAEVAKGANDMSRNAGDAASGANDMSRNAGEAAKAGKAISASIQGLDRATSDNAESAKRVNTSAQELTQIAGELQKLVGQFRLGK